jgi:hypothetical protein
MFSRKKLFWTPFEKSVYAHLAPFAHKPNTALPRNQGGRGADRENKNQNFLNTNLFFMNV